VICIDARERSLVRKQGDRDVSRSERSQNLSRSDDVNEALKKGDTTMHAKPSTHLTYLVDQLGVVVQLDI
jgi:hypothetical protein